MPAPPPLRGIRLGPRYDDRDHDRPIIVHCVALMIQAKTKCTDEQSLESAWDIFDYFGQPKSLAAEQKE